MGGDTYAITARDAGDITGGLNAADAVLDMSGVQETVTQFFDGTSNRGRLQRAQRQPSASDSNPEEPPEACESAPGATSPEMGAFPDVPKG